MPEFLLPAPVCGDGDGVSHTLTHMAIGDVLHALRQTDDGSGGLVQNSVDGMHVSQMKGAVSIGHLPRGALL